MGVYGIKHVISLQTYTYITTYKIRNTGPHAHPDMDRKLWHAGISGFAVSRLPFQRAEADPDTGQRLDREGTGVLEKTLFAGVADKCGAALEVQLGHQVRPVGLHGTDADVEDVRGLAIRVAERDIL